MGLKNLYQGPNCKTRKQLFREKLIVRLLIASICLDLNSCMLVLLHTTRYPSDVAEQMWGVGCRQQVPAEVADNSTEASAREFQIVEAC